MKTTTDDILAKINEDLRQYIRETGNMAGRWQHGLNELLAELRPVLDANVDRVRAGGPDAEVAANNLDYCRDIAVVRAARISERFVDEQREAIGDFVLNTIESLLPPPFGTLLTAVTAAGAVLDLGGAAEPVLVGEPLLKDMSEDEGLSQNERLAEAERALAADNLRRVAEGDPDKVLSQETPAGEGDPAASSATAGAATVDEPASQEAFSEERGI